MVSDLISGGVAVSDGRIMRGDILLAVNEESLQGVTRDTAIEVDML